MVERASDARAERRAQIGQEQRARTRAAILDATFHVIGHEHGRLARIEQIVQVAKIARPTFYTYFSSMEELFNALSYELSHDFNTAVHAYYKTLGSPAEQTSAAVRYNLNKALADHKWAWSMINMSFGGPIFGAENFAAATATVKAGIETGHFTITDVRVGRDLVLGTVLAAMKTIVAGTRVKSYPEAVTLQVLIGLGVSTAKANKLVAMPLPDLVRAGAKSVRRA